MDLTARSYQKELLDRDDIPFEAIERNMHELDVINSWLGGHRISIQGLHALADDKKKMAICEIGCGGGDNLAAIGKWCKKRNIEARFVGIDINPNCLAVAKKKIPDSGARFIESDYRYVDFGEEKMDIVFSSLFCHHFADDELIRMLHWMRSQSRIGFFINDLHRHALAYHGIRLLTRIFSRSWLVKHDAPLSVLRGFTAGDWEELMKDSGISNYSIHWKWAFRWLIVVKHNH